MGDIVQKYKRDGRIVNLRAFAIFVVVFGHSIILYEEAWTLYTTSRFVPLFDIIKRWIDLIQMTLFFSLSGYLFYFTYSRSNIIKLIKKKLKRLLLPFFAFALLWMIPIRKLVGWSGYQDRTILDVLWNSIILGNDCGHLWFLPCLFFCFLITYAFIYLLNFLKINENTSHIILFILAYAASYFFYLVPAFPGSELIRAVALNWIWFYSGFLLCHLSKHIQTLRKYKLVILLLAVAFSYFSLLHIMPYDRITKFVLLIACYVIIPENTNKITEFLNKNSFGVYLFHSPLIYITFSRIPDGNPIFVVLLNFLGFGGLSVAFTVLLRKTRAKILIGE